MDLPNIVVSILLTTYLLTNLIKALVEQMLHLLLVRDLLFQLRIKIVQVYNKLLDFLIKLLLCIIEFELCFHLANPECANRILDIYEEVFCDNILVAIAYFGCVFASIIASLFVSKNAIQSTCDSSLTKSAILLCM